MRMAVPVNILGLPSCAAVVGRDDNLPQGVQLIGARFREDLLLDAARAIEDRAPASRRSSRASPWPHNTPLSPASGSGALSNRRPRRARRGLADPGTPVYGEAEGIDAALPTSAHVGGRVTCGTFLGGMGLTGSSNGHQAGGMVHGASTDLLVSRSDRAPRTAQQAGEAIDEVGPAVSIVIVQHHNQGDLERCLPSVLDQGEESLEVIVVDNAAGDGTAEWLARTYPDVRVVDAGGDIGYPGAANIGIRLARGRHIMALNADVVLHAGCLSALSDAQDAHPNALLNPVFLLPDGRVNTFGNDLHYTGVTVCRRLGEDPDALNDLEPLPALSGTAIYARREVWNQVGGFDGRYFMYFDDTDLSLRARIAGFELLGVSGARVTHHWAFGMNPEKFEALERNRLATFYKVCARGTLARLGPALLLTELATWAFALMRGPAFLRARWRGYASLWRSRDLWRDARQEVQASRRVSDDVLFEDSRTSLPLGQLVEEGLASRLERLTGAVYGVLRPRRFSPPTVLLVCSHGGHLTEMLRLVPALADRPVVMVTYHDARRFISDLGQHTDPPFSVHYTDEIGFNPFRMARAFFTMLGIVRRERPHAVITTGAEIGLPAMVAGRLFGARTIYIESVCRVRSTSLTGRLVYPIVDDFLVQWPEAIEGYGPKARFEGSVM